MHTILSYAYEVLSRPHEVLSRAQDIGLCVCDYCMRYCVSSWARRKGKNILKAGPGSSVVSRISSRCFCIYFISEIKWNVMVPTLWQTKHQHTLLLPAAVLLRQRAAGGRLSSSTSCFVCLANLKVTPASLLRTGAHAYWCYTRIIHRAVRTGPALYLVRS